MSTSNGDLRLHGGGDRGPDCFLLGELAIECADIQKLIIGSYKRFYTIAVSLYPPKSLVVQTATRENRTLEFHTSLPIESTVVRTQAHERSGPLVAAYDLDFFFPAVRIMRACMKAAPRKRGTWDPR